MRLAILGVVVVVVVFCVSGSSARSPVYGGRQVSDKEREDALWWVKRGGTKGSNNRNPDNTSDGNNGNNNPVSDRNNVGNVDTTTRPTTTTKPTRRPTYSRTNRRNNRRNNRNNRRNDINSRNNRRNNGRYNRNNRRNSRNNGRNNGRNYGRNGGYAVGRTRPADTTTRSTTTTTTTTTRPTTTFDVCTTLALEGSCDFYGYPQCLQAALNTCRQPKPLAVWAQKICQLSVLREPEFVGEGVEYISFFRRCSTVSLLPYAGSVDCAGVNNTILSTVTRDQTQCLFQEGAFCRVIVDPQNCAALFHIFALDHAGELQFVIFDTFNFLITRCDQSAQDTFNDIFVKKFLDQVSATATTTTPTTTTSRMMMGGFGRD